MPYIPSGDTHLFIRITLPHLFSVSVPCLPRLVFISPLIFYLSVILLSVPIFAVSYSDFDSLFILHSLFSVKSPLLTPCILITRMCSGLASTVSYSSQYLNSFFILKKLIYLRSNMSKSVLSNSIINEYIGGSQTLTHASRYPYACDCVMSYHTFFFLLPVCSQSLESPQENWHCM